MGDREDGKPRFACGGVKHFGDIEWRPFEPSRKAGRCEQVVKFQRKTLARFLWQERLDIDYADLIETRFQDMPDQGFQADVLPIGPCFLKNCRHQHRLRALRCGRIYADERQQ